MINKYNQSLTDYLVRLMPDFPKNLTTGNSDMTDSVAANSLFTIWKDSRNKVKHNLYNRPTTLSAHEVDLMQKKGLVRRLGNMLEITNKGANVIKIMILGHDSSIFDKEPSVDYHRALAQMKKTSRRTARKIASDTTDSWWRRFE